MPTQSVTRRGFLEMSGLAATGVLFAGCTNDVGATQKHFTDINVAFFAGGPKGDNFAMVVYNGAKTAEQDLGCTIEYIWSDWNTEKMVVQFKEMIDKRPDAICLMGHPGEEILGPLIDEAVRKGVIVTLQNVDLPEVRKKYISQGTGYVGQKLYQSGLMLSRGAVRKFGLKAGYKALVFGLLSEAGRGARTKGCIDGLEENGLVVSHKELTNEVNANPDSAAGEKFFALALDEHPDVKLIITDHGPCTSTASNHLKNLGKKPGEIIIAGFDLAPKTIKGIQDGYIGLVHDQQPYLQGYLPVLQVCLSKKYGIAGLDIDTGSGLVDSSNVEAVANLAEQKIR